ncbi:MAG: iron-sulfur cluster assembly scaffold protein [Planctomycetaceae bacterium]|nr:iron-sulfur cluster assembly scaffold protein [Planctomycetaceae bacterium]
MPFTDCLLIHDTAIPVGIIHASQYSRFGDIMTEYGPESFARTMAWEYSKKTTELFTAAMQGKPGTHIGEIDKPDGRGEHGSIACGDALLFTFKVQRDENEPLNDKIIETKYLTFGCTSAIAASEALCCIIEERQLTPVEALKITNQDIVDFLDGLPDQKIHCSVMGAEALQAAVFDWAQKRGVNLAALGIDIHPEEQEEGRIVCKCFTLTEPYIKRKIKELNLRTIPDIASAIKAGGACMSCQHSPGGLQDLLDEVWGQESTPPPPSTALPLLNVLPEPPPKVNRPSTDFSQQALSPFQFSKKIEKLLNEYVRPMLQRDGGDLELIDIKDTMVYVELRGTCSSCASAGQTLRNLVERTLKEQVDERIRVIQV